MTSARSMLATAIGMKKTLVLGLLVQGLAGLMSGLSDNYAELAFFRVVSGIGGSVFIAVGTAAVVVWFRQQDVTLALGITGGAVFSAGAACALYGWLYVQRATSWHTSLILAGAFELVVMLVTMATFRVPDGERSLGGARFDRAALGATLANRDLWFYGLALLGGYGAYFTTSQLFRHLVAHTGFDVGWVFLAIVSFAFALLGLAGRNPATAKWR